MGPTRVASLLSVLIIIGVGLSLVTKAPTPEEIKNKILSCNSEKKFSDCLKNVAQMAVASAGNKAPAMYLEKIAHEATPACHQFGHYLGEALYQRDKNFSRALTSCTNSCYDSCYHGVAEARFLELGRGLDENLLKEEFRSIEMCNPSDKTCEERAATSMHGAGHALMALTDLNLLKSLSLCDTFRSAKSCYSGVFMSNSVSLDSADHVSDFIRRDDLLYPCRLVGLKYLGACYENQAQFSISGDFKEDLVFCNSFPKEFEDLCFLELTRKKIVGNKNIDIKGLKDTCDKVGSIDERSYCFTGDIKNIYGRSINSFKDMVPFCEMLEPRYKTSCYLSIRFYNSIRKTERPREFINSACLLIKEKDFTPWCSLYTLPQ